MNAAHLLNAPQNVNHIPEPGSLWQEKSSPTADMATGTISRDKAILIKNN
jgi:hypothetical protein